MAADRLTLPREGSPWTERDHDEWRAFLAAINAEMPKPERTPERLLMARRLFSRGVAHGRREAREETP